MIKEVGSGLNDERPKLTQLLMSEVPIDRVIVEHKDRLTRFGFNYLQILADKMGFEIIVVNPTVTDKEDLMQDFTSVVKSFCVQSYSQRRAKRRTMQLIEQLNEENEHAVDRTTHR